ncbi:hypothetical protein DID78_04590, partial [Candidatus Marinamargulisbacteria bacterium SCGC AG-343-D04]
RYTKHMSIEIGHHDIDEHHEELFALDVMLDKAVSTCRRTEIEPIIEFLEHYSVDHFKEEEDLMKDNEYMGLALHESEHRMFRNFVLEIRRLFDDKAPITHVIFKIRKLIDQLTVHIRTVDIGIKDLI